MNKEEICTCKESSEFSRNSSHTLGCLIHCTHHGVNRDGEWQCECGASWEDEITQMSQNSSIRTYP